MVLDKYLRVRRYDKSTFIASSSHPVATRYFGDSCKLKMTYRQRNITKVRAPLYLLSSNYLSNVIKTLHRITVCHFTTVSQVIGFPVTTYSEYLQPLFSASGHWPAAKFGPQEKFTMRGHSMSEATSCPRDQNADRNVNSHC